MIRQKSAEYPAVNLATVNDSSNEYWEIANGSSAVLHDQVDIQTALEPVQSGLAMVEEKMKSVDSTLFAPLARAFVDLIGRGGKRLRPALALLSAEFNGAIQRRPEYQRVISIAAAVEMLHTASLVHDDVIDGALLRRGAPTLNAEWDKGATVLAGNYMFARAAHFAAETDKMRVIHLFSDTLKVMVGGELDQIADRFQYNQEKERYYHRIFAKTASLFCAATESAAVLSGLPKGQVEQLRNFGYNLGMAFQIMDDILDFTSDEESLGKPVGSDLAQGTLTLPFFYFLQEQGHSLIEYLEMKREEAEDDDPFIWSQTVSEVAHEIRNSSAVDQARQEVLSFLGQAQNNLASFADNIYKQSMLDLCRFVMQRSY
ncbi:polyprenyl synthetase family protein [Chloroflexi bacterium TSY]|nr:polyprenyl synthetase family protein [Chloroflexi bacterium TSY]